MNIELQDEKETFGKDSDGRYYIDFSRKNDELQDLVLHKCYRNPKKILTAAFCLGLGVYNKQKSGEFLMVQRLENNEHWESLGFVVKEGDSKDGSLMKINRPNNNSSLIKNDLLDSDYVITVYKATEFKEELDYIVKSILEDLEKELRPEDISVICMDSYNSRKYFDYIEKILDQEGVKVFNLMNAPSNNKFFKIPNHVTLSTIFNAKGNESGSVHITGIDSVFTSKNDITERNKIFTAMTRSMAWVSLSGVGDSVNYCIDELNKLKENDYELVFNQPSETDVKTIRQTIDKKQNLLNKIERIAEDLMKETGESKDEIVEQLKLKFIKKNHD